VTSRKRKEYEVTFKVCCDDLSLEEIQEQAQLELTDSGDYEYEVERVELLPKRRGERRG